MNLRQPAINLKRPGGSNWITRSYNILFVSYSHLEGINVPTQAVLVGVFEILFSLQQKTQHKFDMTGFATQRCKRETVTRFVAKTLVTYLKTELFLLNQDFIVLTINILLSSCFGFYIYIIKVSISAVYWFRLPRNHSWNSWVMQEQKRCL